TVRTLLHSPTTDAAKRLAYALRPPPLVSWRNDRLIAIPAGVTSHELMLPVVAFSGGLKKAVSEFFVKYNELQGRTFRPLRYASPSRAIRIVRKASLGA